MRSLFLKIFLSYWVAQALFLVLAILITMAVRERGDNRHVGRPTNQRSQQGHPDLRAGRSGRGPKIL